MAIDDKYLGLLGTYIYDKRTKMEGMISDLCIMVFCRSKLFLKKLKNKKDSTF